MKKALAVLSATAMFSGVGAYAEISCVSKDNRHISLEKVNEYGQATRYSHPRAHVVFNIDVNGHQRIVHGYAERVDANAAGSNAIVHFGKQLTAENGSLIYLGAVETGQNVADTVQDAVGVVTNTYDNAGKALGKSGLKKAEVLPVLTTDVAGQTINLVLESTTETTSDIFKTFAQFTTDNTSNALSKGFGQIEEFIAPDELDGPISYVREGVSYVPAVFRWGFNIFTGTFNYLANWGSDIVTSFGEESADIVCAVSGNFHLDSSAPEATVDETVDGVVTVGAKAVRPVTQLVQEVRNGTLFPSLVASLNEVLSKNSPSNDDKGADESYDEAYNSGRNAYDMD